VSFVSIVCRSGFLSIMSDGRVSNNGVSIREDYQKFLLPRPDFFIAFAGQQQPCEAFINDSGLSSSNTFDYHTLAADIHRKLLTPPYCNYKILLAFGGRTAKGSLEFCTFSTLEPEIQVFSPSSNQISYAFLNNSEIDDTILQPELVKYLTEIGCDAAEKVKTAQETLNNYVAEIDTSVNTTVFSAIIFAEILVMPSGREFYLQFLNRAGTNPHDCPLMKL